MSILLDYNYRKEQVNIPEDQIRRITEADVAASEIPSIIAEAAQIIRERFMEEARHVKSKDYFMHSRVKRHMVEQVVDMAMTRASREDDEPHAVVNVDYLSGYGCGGVWKEVFFGEVSWKVYLQRFKVLARRDYIEIGMSYDGFEHMAYTHMTNAKLYALFLVDAAHRLIDLAVEPIILELDSFYLSQEIYFSALPYIIDPFVSKYQGITRVCSKGNRCTVNFYLSDTEKAFITFFRDSLPWDIPAAPTDPESLRAECAKEESPFTVAVLSKSDRRFLKNYQSPNP